MSKSGTCELCGMSDNSYTIEDDSGNVLKVCKLCHDGYLEKTGRDPETEGIVDPVSQIVVDSKTDGSKVQALTPEEMAKLLKPNSEERRKLYASLRKRQRELDAEKDVDKDESKYVQEQLRFLEDIEKEKDVAKEKADARDRADAKERELEDKFDDEEPLSLNKNLDDSLLKGRIVLDGKVDRKTEAALGPLIKGSKKQKERKPLREYPDKEHRRDYAKERVRAAARVKSDDERITITSPEVELKTDKRYKTNLDVAVSEYESGVRFLDVFHYVMHPISYCIFVGVIVLAVATTMFVSSWMQGVINLAAGLGATAACMGLMWYLKSRLMTDRRTYLLRIRQEQILFDSMRTECYRQLRTRYPMIKSIAAACQRLSVIVPFLVVVAGGIAAVVTSFTFYYWLLAPVLVGSACAAILLYYIFALMSNMIYYKLDLEKNAQIQQQTLLDLLSKK